MATFTAAIVRAALPSDLDAIVALEQATPAAAHWRAEHYSEAVSGQSGPRKMLVVESHSEPLGVCGFAVMHFVHDECEIENIAISAAMQRKGIGQLLLKCMLQEAKDRNASRVLLEVRSGNAAAIALYKKCGFQLDSVRKGYYSAPVGAALLFSLSLGNSS